MVDNAGFSISQAGEVVNALFLSGKDNVSWLSNAQVKVVNALFFSGKDNSQAYIFVSQEL